MTIGFLYRFFRHDNAEDDTTEWNVYSSHLEDNYRIYRFFYKSSTKHIDFERIANIKGGADCMLEIKEALIVLQSDSTVASEKFKQACFDLYQEDPWLNKLED